jgi:hypothetical protein
MSGLPKAHEFVTQRKSVVSPNLFWDVAGNEAFLQANDKDIGYSKRSPNPANNTL